MFRRRKFKTKAKLGSANGRQFKSKYEENVWSSLKQVRKGLTIEYEPDRIIYVTQRKYNPDLKFTRKDGTFWYLELKGWLRPEDRTKMIAVKAFNPDLDIRILFAQDKPLYKGSKSKYSDWARKNGFMYAFGSKVPKDWLQE